MRDGISLARRGIPVACLVTTEFSEQSDAVAGAVGMPAVPRVVIQHPVAGTGPETMRSIADKALADILDALQGDQ